MKTLITLIISCFIANTLCFGQHAHFTNSGTIEYQKTANMYAMMKRIFSADLYGGLQQQFIDNYQKNQPQFRVTKSTLTFADNKTLFKPVPLDAALPNFTTTFSEQLNTIYTDFGAQSTITEKNIRDNYILVKDSLRKITWKITGETRDVAGYPCRRANGLVLDSVYVVAFYTDKIPVSGGPESLSGLPGMILQASLTHENITWVATKVSETEIAPGTIVAPKKGKVMTPKQLLDLAKSYYGKQTDERTMTLIRGIMF